MQSFFNQWFFTDFEKIFKACFKRKANQRPYIYFQTTLYTGVIFWIAHVEHSIADVKVEQEMTVTFCHER